MPHKNPEQKRAYHQAYYQAHKEEWRAYQRTYDQAHREERLARQRAYNQAHREEKQAYQRAYDQAHREERLAHYQAHREEKQAYQRAYDQAHRKEKQAYNQTYGQANREKITAQNRAYRQSRKYDPAFRAMGRRRTMARRARKLAAKTFLVTKRDQRRLLARQRGVCYYCRVRLPTEWDHVIPLKRGGAHSIGNLVLACRSCNSSKGAKLLIEWSQGPRLL